MTGTRDSRDGAWLSDALRDRAQSHDADLARITARFEQLTDGRATCAAPRRRVSGPMRVRLLGIPLGIAAALTSATLAVAVSVGIAVSASAHPTVPVVTPKTSAAPTAAPTTAAHHSPTPSSAPAALPTATAAPKPTGSAVATGRLATTAWVDSHSTEYWAQEDLDFTTTSAVRTLRITVTVSGGSGVASTGSWTTIATANLDTVVTRVPGGLEYEVTLKPGLSLPAALNRLGFQFNRPAGGHDFALDTYSISATAADGATLSASGTFGG